MPIMSENGWVPLDNFLDQNKVSKQIQSFESQAQSLQRLDQGFGFAVNGLDTHTLYLRASENPNGLPAVHIRSNIPLVDLQLETYVYTISSLRFNRRKRTVFMRKGHFFYPKRGQLEQPIPVAPYDPTNYDNNLELRKDSKHKKDFSDCVKVLISTDYQRIIDIFNVVQPDQVLDRFGRTADQKKEIKQFQNKILPLAQQYLCQRSTGAFNLYTFDHIPISISNNTVNSRVSKEITIRRFSSFLNPNNMKINAYDVFKIIPDYKDIFRYREYLAPLITGKTDIISPPVPLFNQAATITEAKILFDQLSSLTYFDW